MFNYLQAGIKKISHDWRINFIVNQNTGYYTFGYVPSFGTHQFRQLSKKFRDFITLPQEDRVEFMHVLRNIEIRLLYLQVPEEKITNITDSLLNIFNFLMRLPKKYLKEMPAIAKASSLMGFMRNSRNSVEDNQWVLMGLEILGESNEKIFAVVNSYGGLTNQLVAAFKQCNPVNLEAEQNLLACNPEQFLQRMQQDRKAADVRHNFQLFLQGSWAVSLIFTIAAYCSEKDSLLNKYVLFFGVILLIFNYAMYVDTALAGLRMIKNNEHQDISLLIELAQLSDIIVRGLTWRNFHSDPTLKPQNSSELAEKIFLLRSGFTLEGVSAVVKDYLLEDETVDTNFSAELFVQALEKEFVNDAQMQLFAIYDGDEVTHEALVAQVAEAVTALRNAKRISASLSSKGWFSETVSSATSGLRRRIGFGI